MKTRAVCSSGRSYWKRFLRADYNEAKDKFQIDALSLFENKTGNGHPVRLHVKGTPFQIKTWNKLLKIISCHRTVRASGEFGGYHWGANRKAALICLEAVQSGR